MQMNRWEHDLKAEAMLELCLRCEGCSEPSGCAALAEWIVKRKAAAGKTPEERDGE